MLVSCACHVTISTTLCCTHVSTQSHRCPGCYNTPVLSMAEYPGTTSGAVPMQSEQESSLQAVDLDLQQSQSSFGGGGEEMMQNEIAPIEGTEVRESRPRTSSKGTLKEWSTHQIKVTKQVVSEKLGRGTKTVDPLLDARIESLRETQRKYSQMIALSTQFHLQFRQVVETQKTMAEHFAFMSVRCPELHTEFHFNSSGQKQMAQYGEKLIAAVQYFSSNLQTVSTKTMEDTLMTVRSYETARLNYDAYRTDLEKLKQQAATSQAAASRLSLATVEFEKHKKKFEQLRHDVDVKLKLLEHNKIQVTHKQLIHLMESFTSFFSGNYSAMDGLLKELTSKVEETRTNDPPEWLEQLDH